MVPRCRGSASPVPGPAPSAAPPTPTAARSSAAKPAGNYTLTPTLGAGYVDFRRRKSLAEDRQRHRRHDTPARRCEYDKAGTVRSTSRSVSSNPAASPPPQPTRSRRRQRRDRSTGGRSLRKPGGPFERLVKATPLYSRSPTPTTSTPAPAPAPTSPKWEPKRPANVKVPAGGTAAATIQLPALYLTVKNSSETTAEKNALPGANVTVTDTRCSVGGNSVKRTLRQRDAPPPAGLADPGLPGARTTSARPRLSGKPAPVRSPGVVVHSLNGTSVTQPSMHRGLGPKPENAHDATSSRSATRAA